MSNRMQRADAEITRVLSDIISHKLNDPRFEKLLTVTGVKTSPDFKHCKVWVSVYSENETEKKNILKLLNNSSGFIKKEMADSLNLPSIPNLIFELDSTAEHSKRINEILSSLTIPKEEDDERDNKED